MKSKLKECFEHIKSWMSDNYLKLNNNKSEIIEISTNSKASETNFSETNLKFYPLLYNYNIIIFISLRLKV